MAAVFENWEYILLLFFGGAVVAVHANSLFSQRVSETSADGRADPLASLSLPVILGQNDYRRGFAVYLLANELLYTILASSSTILGLTLEVLGQQNTVGALSENLKPSLLYPIVASSVVVLMSQAKPTSGIEKTFRRMAHSVAGVQRNLDEVKTRIHKIALNTSLEDKLVISATERARNLAEVAPTSYITEFERANFAASLTRVHCLYYWTLGYRGQSIWFSEHSRQIKSLFDSLHLEYGNLCNEAFAMGQVSISSGSTFNAEAERWKVIIRATYQLENRLTTVLSLLLINQPDADFDNEPALHELRDVVLKKRAGDHPDVSSLVGQSMLYALPFMLVLATLHGGSTRLWRSLTSQRLDNLPDFPRVVDISFFDRLLSLPEKFFSHPEKLDFLSTTIGDAMIGTVDYTLIFIISVGIAMFYRKSQMELQRWNAHSEYGIPNTYSPVVRYLFLGGLGYLFSTAVFLVWRFLVFNIIEPLRSGIPIQVDVSMRGFGEYLPDFLLEPITAFVCVWFVLQFADRDCARDGKFASTALRYSLVCTVLVVMQNIVRNDFPNDTAIATYILRPLCGYLVLFIAFARVYKWYTVKETIPLSKRSLIARLLLSGFHRIRKIFQSHNEQKMDANIDKRKDYA